VSIWRSQAGTAISLTEMALGEANDHTIVRGVVCWSGKLSDRIYNGLDSQMAGGA
jgi:hypothetical protein